MSRSRYYSSNYGRASQPKQGANVIPYLIVALLALIVWLYLHNAPPPVEINVNGRLFDAYTGAPIPAAQIEVHETGGPNPAMASTQNNGAIVPGANITVAGAQTATLPLVPSPAPLITATTAISGEFALLNPPANGWIHVAVPGYAPQDVELGGHTSVEISLVPNILRGRVLNESGAPVARASVYNGKATASTDVDGNFALDNVSDHNLTVKAPGYRASRMEFGNVVQQDVELKQFSAKAIYISADTAASPGKFYDLIKLVDDTELDAVIIDVKADTTGYVLYDSKLAEVQAMGSANPVVADIKTMVDTLHERNIYVIARQALFWDERLAQARPDLAIRSKSTGQPWEDAYSHRWANPRMQEVWAYNLAIAKEVASIGFDEIQFDYVRFPSDGNLADADYGPTDGTTRAQTIASFLKRAYDELSPLGIYISADVFGLSPIVDDDLGIGQQWEEIAGQVDYICPMAYPSHYAKGFLDYEQPAEHPGEIVGYTIKEGQKKLLGRRALIRPWLQDFSLYGVTYEASRVRGQIDVSEQMGTSGWMLWNFDNVYTADALKGK